MFKKSFVISFLILSFVVVSSYAGNIGRNVYGVLAETVSGVNLAENVFVDDSARLYQWNNLYTGTKYDSSAEGGQYTSCNITGAGGGGVTFVSSSGGAIGKDMSGYYKGKLKFLARISNSQCANIKICIQFGNVKKDMPLSSSKKSETEYFDVNSTDWQEVYYELDESFGKDDSGYEVNATTLKNISYLFLIDCPSGINGTLDIDYVRWVKKDTPTTLDTTLNVSLKKVSDNGGDSSSTISWSSEYGGYVSNLDTKKVSFVSDTFQKGWTIANRYLEIDLTGFDADLALKNIPSGDWCISIYVRNSSSTRNGLYATKSGQDFVLPMAWRVDKDLISHTTPTSSNVPSFLMKEIVLDGNKGHLLDANYDKDTYAWYYFVDSSEFGNTDKKNFAKVWSYKKGLRYGEGPNDMGHVGETKPKVYLALNTKDAFGGLIYKSENIKVELSYE